MYRINIDGVIGFDVMAKDIRSEIKSAGSEGIDLRISSPGGAVYEGIAIFNEIMDYRRKGGKVSATVIGMAASMSSYIPLAADNFSVEDNAVYMIHNPWAMAVGDQNEMKKLSERLEAIAVVLSKEYAKKTGKPMDEIRKMMDEETYLFGNDIVKIGFADSVIPAGDGAETQEEAFAYARTNVDGMKSVLEQSPEANQLDKAVAMLGSTALTPVSAGENKSNFTEAKKSMNLTDLLKENPEAKAEYDEKISAAEAKGKEMEARIKAVAPYIGNAAYKGIDALAIKVLKGESAVAALEGAVAVLDMQKESGSVATAQEETEEVPETPAGPVAQVSTDGVIRNEEDIKATQDRLAQYL